MQPHILSECVCLREPTECVLQSKSVGVWRAAPKLSTLSELRGVTSCGNRHRVCKQHDTFTERGPKHLAGTRVTSHVIAHCGLTVVCEAHNFTRKFSSLCLLPSENSFCSFQDFFKIESLLLLIINHLVLFVDFLCDL